MAGDPRAKEGNHFGLILRRLRVAAMLSQEQLAQRAGLSVRAVRDIERGRVARPRGDSIRMLADALVLDASARSEFFLSSALSCAGPVEAEAALGADLTANASAHAHAHANANASAHAHGYGYGYVHERDGELPAPPAQLPLDVPCFAGRRPEMAWLNGRIAESSRHLEAVTTIVLSGVAGGGKSALAVHWAHTVRNLFPDGQLHMVMREPDTGGRKPAERCLTDALTALRPAEDKLPHTLDALTGMYRTLTADRRMLIVLDDVEDAGQVRPLLPATAGSVVLVTSRRQLVGLVAAVGAQPLKIDLPTWPDARELLARRIGADRVAAEPEGADAIIRRCARLPLALAVIAARAAVRPDVSLWALAAELDGSEGVPDAFTVNDATADVRSTFQSAVASLPQDAVRLFRLLGHSGNDELTMDAVTEQTGMSSARVRVALDDLVRAHIIAEHAPGRFGTHGLLLAYARELSAGGRRLLPENRLTAASSRPCGVA